MIVVNSITTGTLRATISYSYNWPFQGNYNVDMALIANEFDSSAVVEKSVAVGGP